MAEGLQTVATRLERAARLLRLPASDAAPDVGPDGLVVGVDIARPMLARAAARVVLSSFATASDRPARWRRLLLDRFALHVVSLPALARELQALGFADAEWRMSGPVFGRAWARRPG